MLTTTIYDQSNATITGTYYSNKGECITVEYMGSALECECYMNGVYQADDGSNEVAHVKVYASSNYATKMHTGFALHNAWHSVVQM